MGAIWGCCMCFYRDPNYLQPIMGPWGYLPQHNSGSTVLHSDKKIWLYCRILNLLDCRKRISPPRSVKSICCVNMAGKVVPGLYDCLWLQKIIRDSPLGPPQNCYQSNDLTWRCLFITIGWAVWTSKCFGAKIHLKPDTHNTQRKKGTKTVPLGYYCYKWYPFFKGALFFP